jgi:hypothetical protein
MSTTFVATAGLETAPIQDGSVLYDPRTGKFIMLNRSAALLWTELKTPKTEGELVRLLGVTFPDAATAGQDVGPALERLKAMELVVCDGETSADAGATAAPSGNAVDGMDKPAAYERPALRVLDEEELLNIFQMTAAEISVASCWWSACPSGCP